MLENHLPPNLLEAIQNDEFTLLDQPERERFVKLWHRYFRSFGTFVDWSLIENHVSAFEPDGNKLGEKLRGFFEQNLAHRGEEPACYLNDGIRIGLEGTVQRFSDRIEDFVDVLHTGYFIGADGTWCLAIRMSGQLDYGELPLPDPN